MPIIRFHFWRQPLTLCALGVALHANAQPFADLEQRLLEHPELAALRYDAVAQREQATAQTGLPDPMVSIGVSNFPIFDPAFDRYLPTSKTLGVKQRIPNGATRDAKSTASRAVAARIDALHAMHLATLRAELIVVLVERQRIARERDLVARQADLYAQWIDIVETQIQAGRPLVSQRDMLDVRQTRIATEQVALDEEAVAVAARLMALVNVPALSAMPPAQNPLDWDNDARRFHSVQVALAQVDMAEADVEAARMAWRPDWNLELTYQQRESGANGSFEGDDWITGAVGFTVPLWANSSQRPRLRAASAEREAALSRFAAAARKSAAEYAVHAAAVERARRTAQLLEREIDALEAQVEAQRVLYESAQGDYMAVIERQIEVLQRRVELVRERARGESAIASMNRLVVTP